MSEEITLNDRMRFLRNDKHNKKARKEYDYWKHHDVYHKDISENSMITTEGLVRIVGSGTILLTDSHQKSIPVSKEYLIDYIHELELVLELRERYIRRMRRRERHRDH